MSVTWLKFSQLCMAWVGKPPKFHAEIAHKQLSKGLAICPTLACWLIQIHGAVLEECWIRRTGLSIFIIHIYYFVSKKKKKNLIDRKGTSFLFLVHTGTLVTSVFLSVWGRFTFFTKALWGYCWFCFMIFLSSFAITISASVMWSLLAAFRCEMLF